MVFRDTPSRREISRIGTCSRLCHRRIMLKNAMSNTPVAPAWSRRGSVQTWVNSQWKNPASPGQFSVEINSTLTLANALTSVFARGAGDTGNGTVTGLSAGVTAKVGDYTITILTGASTF